MTGEKNRRSAAPTDVRSGRVRFIDATLKWVRVLKTVNRPRAAAEEATSDDLGIGGASSGSLIDFRLETRFQKAHE
jgi:hypothetical protein